MWLKNCRTSKKCRITIIGSLMFIVILLLIFWKKGTTALIVILILLAVAIGIEGFNYDVDLGKLWQTGSYKESRVESIKDKDGNTIKLIGKCVKADINCNNFKTQKDAQIMYEECANEIKRNNKDIKNPLKLDIYGLDRDKDGIVCEHLPQFVK